MKKSQPTVAIYYRTNYETNMAPLHNLEAYAKENGVAPIIFIDIKSALENRPSLKQIIKPSSRQQNRNYYY